jgi:ATP-binding cassette subfamily B protein
MSSRADLLIKNPLLYCIKTYRKDFALGIGFLFITNGLDAFWPMLLKTAIDQVATKAPMSEITRTSLYFLAVLSTLALTRYLWRTFFGRYHSFAAEDVRNKIFQKFTCSAGFPRIPSPMLRPLLDPYFHPNFLG